MGNLFSRIIVAAILLPLAIGVLWLGGWWLTGFGVVVGLLALHELWTMARGHRPIVIAGYLGVIAVVVGAHLDGNEGMVLALAPTLLIVFILAAISPSPSASSLTGMSVTVFGVVWVGVGLGAVVVLRDASFDIVLAVLAGTWGGDIGAYGIGRLFGRRRLAPAISPGKSIEGFAGGVLIGTGIVWWILYGQGFTTVESLIIGFAIAVAGPFGDLLESFVKRDLGVKDSGTLLAGHGGVLDRVDAMLITAPVALLALWAIGSL